MVIDASKQGSRARGCAVLMPQAAYARKTARPKRPKASVSSRRSSNRKRCMAGRLVARSREGEHHLVAQRLGGGPDQEGFLWGCAGLADPAGVHSRRQLGVGEAPQRVVEHAAAAGADRGDLVHAFGRHPVPGQRIVQRGAGGAVQVVGHQRPAGRMPGAAQHVLPALERQQHALPQPLGDLVVRAPVLLQHGQQRAVAERDGAEMLEARLSHLTFVR